MLLVDLKMASKNSNVGKLFDFNINGYGVVTHEAKVDYKTWSPVIHILKFTDDNHKDLIKLRFGYCNNSGRLATSKLAAKSKRQKPKRPVPN